MQLVPLLKLKPSFIESNISMKGHSLEANKDHHHHHHYHHNNTN